MVELEVIVNEQNPDFIILSETHLTRDIEEQKIQHNRYSSYITPSNSNKTGGIIVYFTRQYNVIKIGDNFSNYNYWISE